MIHSENINFTGALGLTKQTLISRNFLNQTYTFEPSIIIFLDSNMTTSQNPKDRKDMPYDWFSPHNLTHRLASSLPTRERGCDIAMT